MFRIQHLLLITVAALCSCATERTVATNFQPRQRPDSEKTDAELMDALEAKFAGGFGQQTDKEGNTRMVSQKRSSFEGLRYSGNTSQIEKKAFETASFEKKKFDGASTRFETKKWDGIKRIRRSLFVSLAASRRVSSLGLNFACSSLENRWLEVS